MANEKPEVKASMTPNISGEGINFPGTKPDTSALAQAQRTASLQNNAPAPIAKPATYYTPAHWNVEADGENIIATHNILGDVFKGSRKEFSDILSGK